MASYKEIDGYLADLPLGPQKLIDIVTKIQSIHSKKHRTQQLLSKQRQSDDYLQHCAVKLDGKFYNLKDILKYRNKIPNSPSKWLNPRLNGLSLETGIKNDKFL